MMAENIAGVAAGLNIELNEQFKKAIKIMDGTNKNIFITGKAGTGKSTLLDLFRKATRKNIAVLAPTGVAAVNVNGQTIHSFFKFRTDTTPQTVEKLKNTDRDLYRAIDTIVIDEISMVRADVLDCIDKFLRINGRNKNIPFGGAQMVFIGDLYQLPPVVTGDEREIFRGYYNTQYFFDSRAFNGLDLEFVELEKIYRQKDGRFIGMLNMIRNNSITEKELGEINKRVNPRFRPDADEFYISLTTTNRLAAETNEIELAKLRSELFTFHCELRGSFDRGRLPTEIDLKVKSGSQIMMVNNDPAGRWVNGTMGRIKCIEKYDSADVINVELANGKSVCVEPFTWKMFRLKYNKLSSHLESEDIGSFTQYPLRLAWAVTIHKSQGKTFDKVIIDIGKGAFSHGQVYVALSRCTSLEGIVLRKPLEKKHIFMDWKVVNFLTKYQYGISEKSCSLDEKIRIIKNAIKNSSKIEIVYLKPNDEKSRRIIRPENVGGMEYKGRPYTGVEGFCFSRNGNRIFRVDRILEIREL